MPEFTTLKIDNLIFLSDLEVKIYLNIMIDLQRAFKIRID